MFSYFGKSEQFKIDKSQTGKNEPKQYSYVYSIQQGNAFNFLLYFDALHKLKFLTSSLVRTPIASHEYPLYCLSPLLLE
jgi:hypothetical protein